MLTLILLPSRRMITPCRERGNCRPLVFFDAAVIMGFEQGHLKILIEWVGLEIKAGRINMRRGNPHAFSHALFPDDGEN